MVPKYLEISKKSDASGLIKGLITVEKESRQQHLSIVTHATAWRRE